MTLGSAVNAPRGSLSKIARGGASNLAGAMVSAVATFAFTVVVARSTDTHQAGIFFALSSAFVIAFSVARLGVPTGLVWALANHRAAGRQELLRPVVTQAVLVVGVVGGLIGAAGMVAAPTLARILAGDDSPGTVWLVRLLALTVALAALNDVAVGTTRGFGVMRPLVVVDRVARPVAQLVLVLVVALLGAGSALTIGLAWLLPILPAAVVLLLWARRLRRSAERRAGVQGARGLQSLLAQAAPFWRFTAPRSVGSVAQMVLQRADIVMLGALSGPATAAVYAAATRFLVVGQLAAGAVSTTIQPTIASLLGQGRTDEARVIYRTVTVWLVLLTWPVYLTSAVFAPQLLTVFGAGYAEGWPVIVLLSLTMLVATGCGAVDTVLVMAGRSSWTMGNALVALGINLVLNVLLIPPYGVVGAAVAWSVAILVNNLLPLVQLACTLHLHPFGRQSTLAAAAAAVCFGMLPGLAVLLGTSTTTRLVAVAVGAVLYAVALRRWRRELQLADLARLRRRRRGAGAEEGSGPGAAP